MKCTSGVPSPAAQCLQTSLTARLMLLAQLCARKPPSTVQRTARLLYEALRPSAARKFNRRSVCRGVFCSMGPHLEENFLQDGAAARAKHEPNYRARLRELHRVGRAGCQAPRHVFDPVEQQRAVRAAVVRRHKRDELRQQHLCPNGTAADSQCRRTQR
jgi:hypothetical protein